jgi:hypothetical protein
VKPPSRLGSTTDEQINAYFAHNPAYGGCISNNQLIHPDPKLTYILNLQNSNQGGSHWTTFHNGHYADSYGVAPTAHVSKYTRDYNPDEYQSLAEESCGYFAIYAAQNFMRGLPPYTGMIPHKYRYNEDVLKREFLAH